ncbi:hypothetical protein ACLX1H_000893 [Fusarium chlamydosporum]
MRPILTFAALVLSGTADLVAGSACKPRPSNTISTLEFSLSTESISTSTPTNDGKLPQVRNLAINGNMAEIDPSNPHIVPDWDVINDAKIVGGQGREEPGSTERGACAMSAANLGLEKRAVGSGVSMSQTMNDLEVGTTYTIRFYYRVVMSQGVTNCQLSAHFGNSLLTEDSITGSDVTDAWTEVLKTADAQETSTALKIEMQCQGGSATILLDSVFASNKVTPGNIDQFTVDFGNNGTGDNPPLEKDPQATTSSVAATALEPITTSGFTVTESKPLAVTTTTATETPFCSKALNGGCWWKGSSLGCANRGSWPGPGGQGSLAPRPDNYPQPRSQLCSMPLIETSTQSSHPPSEPTVAFKLPPASTCPKSLETGCTWNLASHGGSDIKCQYRGRWPGADGAGYAVEPPRDYPMPLSQMQC